LARNLLLLEYTKSHCYSRVHILIVHHKQYMPVGDYQTIFSDITFSQIYF